MIPTTQSDDINDFLDFFAQLVGNKLANNRAGASEEDIDRFKKIASLPLPLLYLGYLREFGEKDPVLKLTGDSSSNVKTILDCYAAPADDPDFEIPNNGVVIGAQSLSGQVLLSYPEALTHGIEEPQVMRGWWGDVSHTLSPTFRNFLYGQAFYRGRWAKGPSFVLNHNSDASFPDATRIALDLGFQPYWFSDPYQQSLERPDGSILLIVRKGSALVIGGSFSDGKSLTAVKERLTTIQGIREVVGSPKRSPGEG